MDYISFNGHWCWYGIIWESFYSTTIPRVHISWNCSGVFCAFDRRKYFKHQMKWNEQEDNRGGWTLKFNGHFYSEAGNIKSNYYCLGVIKNNWLHIFVGVFFRLRLINNSIHFNLKLSRGIGLKMIVVDL